MIKKPPASSSRGFAPFLRGFAPDPRYRLTLRARNGPPHGKSWIRPCTRQCMSFSLLESLHIKTFRLEISGVEKWERRNVDKPPPGRLRLQAGVRRSLC